MKKRNTYGSVYFSLQCLPISHDDRSVEVGLQRNKYALLHFPCDFQAGKKVSFPQKKRIRVR
jgi:hypothetical protein